MKIRSKFIFLILAVVLISVIPISTIILVTNKKVLLKKTNELCQTLGSNLANVSREELLINETYDATTNTISYLRKSKMKGLMNAYVINYENIIVGSIDESKVNQKLSQEDIIYFKSLTILESSQIVKNNINILRFASPVFVQPYQNKILRVGTVVFEFDKKAIFSPIAQLQDNIMHIAMILLGIGLALSLIIAFYFSRPIQKLSEGAKILGGGGLTHRIQINNKDELGELANSFNHMAEKVEDFTHNLETKVNNRTLELNESLKNVQDLKVRQDADYFLTSLLAKPLGTNNNKSDHIHTDFLIKQKKKFKFKHWDSEIGGDLCVTDTLTIGKTVYTVFLNADAMGKSIQGAGGALVLGAVFQAILARSKVARHQVDYPEAWLRDTYMDLQNTFVSFDGSMYMSIVMGLLSHTGMLYLVNTEHPWPLIYSSTKGVRFIEDKNVIHKLGTPGEEKKLFIHTRMLEEGDKLISGSDGRDDIKITNEEGIQVMNEDENLFLEHVGMAGGDIHKLHNLLLNTGEITDDLSLLSVTLTSKVSTPLSSNIETIINEAVSISKHNTKKSIELLEDHSCEGELHSEFMLTIANLYNAQKDYPKALKAFKKYHLLNPIDSETIYTISYLYYQNKEWDLAINESERLYLREPGMLQNLFLLIRLYLQKMNADRAEMFFHLYLLKNPDLTEAKGLFQEITSLKGTVEGVHSDEEIQNKINVANLLYKEKKYEKASVVYKEIVALDDQNDFAWFKLGNTQSLLKQLPQAIQSYTRSLLLAPHNPHARNNYATVLYSLGEIEKAQKQLEELIQDGQTNDFQIANKNLLTLRKKIEQDKIITLM